MAYLGNGPLLGAYTHVDDISSSFDGSAVTFNITKNSISKTPVRAENFLVSIDGVFQEPYESYSILGSTVTFTEAPSAGSSFFGIILGNVLNIGAIPDGSVTIDKMGTGAVGTTAIVDGAVTAAKIAAGAVDTTAIADSAITQAKLDLSSNLLFADGEKAFFGSGNDLTIYHDGSNSFINDQGAGSLRIQTDGTQVKLYDQLNSNIMADFNTGGSVDLYHNGIKKLATTSIGIDVTGKIQVLGGGANLFDNIIQITDDTNDTRISFTRSDTGSNAWLGIPSWDSDAFKIYGPTASGSEIAANYTNQGWSLYGGGSVKLDTTSTGINVTGEFIADSYNETYSNITSSSGTANFDCETGNTFSITLSESVTTTNFQNPPASGTGYTMTIEVIQDSGGSGHLMAWPTSVDWPSATAPTLTATASGKDVFVFTTRDGGTTWYGFTAGQAIG